MKMYLYDYIEKNKNITFQEKDLTDVDAIIFAYLTYANYKRILNPRSKMTIAEVANKHIKTYTKKDNNILAVREANKLLRYLKNIKRYKNCFVSNYEHSESDYSQFCAMTFDYKPNHQYVAFEGTDDLLSGWKEDLLMSYVFPTESQSLAIQYLNKHFTVSFKKLIIGGHSKGGNLALTSSMYANQFVKNKIEKIYSGDGPGLLEKEFQSSAYQSIQDKYIHFIPDYSIVGIMINHSNDYVLHSKSKSFLAHDIFTWQIEDDTFTKSKLSTFSKELDQKLSKWVKETPCEEKKELIINLDNVLKANHIRSLVELKENQLKLLNMIYISKEMNPKIKKMIINFIIMILKSTGKARKEELQLYFSNLFKRDKKESKE